MAGRVVRQIALVAVNLALGDAAYSDILSYKDRNQLYALCGDRKGGMSDGYCFGYVTGMVDMLYTANLAQPNGICIPANVIPEQLKDIVQKYLTDHPEQRQHTAASTALVALRVAFPCKK